MKNFTIVVEKHGIKRPHQMQDIEHFKHYEKYANKWCDIVGCNINDDVQVVRILSDAFAVKTKRCNLASQIVLSEIVIDDNSDDAIEKAINKAINIERPLTIDILKKIRRPLEQGYSFEEVIDAFTPYIIQLAQKYSHTRDLSDSIQLGYIGVDNALKSDRALAPIAKHAFLHICTSIRRGNMSSGVIRHGERDGDLFHNLGCEVGYEDICDVTINDMGRNSSVVTKIIKSYTNDTILPIVIPNLSIEDGERLNYSLSDIGAFVSIRYKKGKIIFNRVIHIESYADETSDPIGNIRDYDSIDPLECVAAREIYELNLSKLRKMIVKADLTENQLKIYCMINGLRIIPNPINKSKSPIEFQMFENGSNISCSDVAIIMGCSRQRIDQQLKKCDIKIDRVKRKDEMRIEVTVTKKEDLPLKEVMRRRTIEYVNRHNLIK